MASFRCTYCESLIPWRLAAADVGIPEGEEPRPGATYPYSGCPCGFGRFVRCEGGPTEGPPAGGSRAGDVLDGAIAAKLADPRYAVLPVDDIRPSPHQPRRFFDARALTGLAASIRMVGLLEDILVRPAGDLLRPGADGYEIVLGERRWRATRVAGLPTIRAKIVDLTDAEAREVSIAENVHRADLTPVEEAFSFKAYVDAGDGVADVGRRFGGLAERVAERLKLLNTHHYVAYQQQRIDELLATVDRLRAAASAPAAAKPAFDAAVVGEDDLVGRLADGYELVAELSGHRFAVRRPI